MGSSWIWAGLLPPCGLAGWLIVRQPLRSLLEIKDNLRARELFRRQREHLEADFVAGVARREPFEAACWDDARWGDNVLYARDRRSRTLLALVAVELDDAEPPLTDRHATAVFEFRGQRWRAEGRHLDDVEPYEAFYRLRDFEPVVLPRRRRLV